MPYGTKKRLFSIFTPYSIIIQTCYNNCQLYMNQKCEIAVIAASLVKTEKSLQKIEKKENNKEN